MPQSSQSITKRNNSSKQSVRSGSQRATLEEVRSGDRSSSEVVRDEFLRVDKTLAIIKPEAMSHADDIEEFIKEHDFEILAKRVVHLTPEQVAGFYKEHYGQPYFANLVIHMSDSHVTVMCLAKDNAISEWLHLIGPTSVIEAQMNAPESLRARYGLVEEDGNFNNGVHGSRDFANSLREIHFFFPKLIEEPILRGKQVHDYLQERVNSTLLKGLEELCKEKPEEPLIWLADWLLTHNPYSPELISSRGSLDEHSKLDSDNSALRPCTCTCECNCGKGE